jgi:hypothetical protein
MERVFTLLVLLLAAVEPLVGVEQRFAMEPQDQTAIVGSRVTLPCRVINKTGVLQWTKDDFGLGTHRNLSGFDRYSMIGSDEEGQFMVRLIIAFTLAIPDTSLIQGVLPTVCMIHSFGLILNGNRSDGLIRQGRRRRISDTFSYSIH